MARTVASWMAKPRRVTSPVRRRARLRSASLRWHKRPPVPLDVLGEPAAVRLGTLSSRRRQRVAACVGASAADQWGPPCPRQTPWWRPANRGDDRWTPG